MCIRDRTSTCKSCPFTLNTQPGTQEKTLIPWIKAVCALIKSKSKGHFVVAIVVRVMYSLFINHSSIVHFQSYSRRKRPTLRRGLGTNNEHLAFLDLGCECGVMKYAFFTLWKIEINPYSGLARYVTRLRMLHSRSWAAEMYGCLRNTQVLNSLVW